MDSKYKFILQLSVVLSITIMACLGILNSEAVILLTGTVVGYLFANVKENIQGKDIEK